MTASSCSTTRIVFPRSRSLLEGLDEALVVDGVEADGGFVADIEDAHEPGADLRSEADALALTAGEGAGRAVEGEVLEADVDEEPEAGGDLLHDLGGDHALAVGEGAVVGFQPGDPGEAAVDGHGGGLDDGVAVDGNAKDFRLEPPALAHLAGALGHEALDLGAHVVGFGVLVPAFEVGDDALERGPEADDPAPRRVR